MPYLYHFQGTCYYCFTVDLLLQSLYMSLDEPSDKSLSVGKAVVLDHEVVPVVLINTSPLTHASASPSQYKLSAFRLRLISTFCTPLPAPSLAVPEMDVSEEI